MRSIVTFLKGAHTNKPTAKFPYQSVEVHGGFVMEGLPPGVDLMRPGRYGIDTLA